MSKRQKIDILELYDLLTGRLAAGERARIESALAADPALQRKMDALCEVHDALAEKADEPMPRGSRQLHRRIMAEAEEMLAGPSALRLWRWANGRRRITWMGWAAAAAAVLLIAVGTGLILRGGSPTPSRQTIARGPAPHQMLQTPALATSDVLAEGRRLETTREPMAGQLACGAALLLDADSRLTVVRSSARSAMLRLERGQVFLQTGAGNVQVATDNGTLTCYGTKVACNLRLARPDEPVRTAHAEGAIETALTDAPTGPALLRDPRLWLTVVRGVVVFTNQTGHTTVRARRTVRVDDAVTGPRAVRLNAQRAIAWTLTDAQLAALGPSVLAETMRGQVAGGDGVTSFTYPFTSRGELDDFVFYPSAARAAVRMDRGLRKPAAERVPLMAHRARFAAIEEVAWWGHFGAATASTLYVNLGETAQIEMRFDGTHCHFAVITAGGRTEAGRIRIERPRYRVRLRREPAGWVLRCNDFGVKTLDASELPGGPAGRVSFSFTDQPAQLLGLEVRGRLEIDWLRERLEQSMPQ